MIQLKNGIDVYWRENLQNETSAKKEEKGIIRSRLFQGTTNEEETILALHNALVVAKVVRIDSSKHWPDALPSIIELLRSGGDGNQRQLSCTLQIPLQVVKELRSARLSDSQRVLRKVAPELARVLIDIYAQNTSRWLGFLAGGQGSEHETQSAMLNSLLALRVLRRLVIDCYENPHTDASVQDIWTISRNQFAQFQSFVSEDSAVPSAYQDVVGKHLLQFTKLHVKLAETHAVSFCMLPDSLSLVRDYWKLVERFANVFDQSGGIRQGGGDVGSAKAKVEGPLFERVALKGLLLLRACVRIAFSPVQTIKYRSPEARAERDNARKLIKEHLFTDEWVKVTDVVDTITKKLFVFRRSDLEAWEEDPEEWEQQEQSEGSAYEWEVRPCAEKLFHDLLTNFKKVKVNGGEGEEELILRLDNDFKATLATDTDILTKERVYATMGLSADRLYGRDDVLDLDTLLESGLINDAQGQGGLYKVLRRRIAILISQWAPVKMADSSRPVVYRIFHHFLNPSDDTNDLVVRITAARQLRCIADELGFSVEAFLPYTADVLSQLIQLIQGVEADDTKLAILETVRIIVTRMLDQVSQFGDRLMEALPGIWQDSGDDKYMIKQAVVAIFTALVTSMGENSLRYQHLMIPLLSEAARPGSGLHVHLIEECLELWDAILAQSKAPLAPEIINLAELALPLLEYESASASWALGIIEAYILIAPSAMLEDRLRRPVLTALSGALDAKDQVRQGTSCIEYLIRAGTEFGGSGGVFVVIQDMLETGFMNKIMTNLRDAWEAQQTTGPNRKVSKLSTTTEGYYFAILSRIALAEPSLFVQMLSAFGGLEEVWGWLSGEWFSHLSSVDDSERQKLYLLGLTRLLELPPPMQNLVLGKLQDYFDTWTSVISEVQDGVMGGPDTLVWGAEDLEEQEYDTPKSVAERMNKAKDPVHSVPAFGFVAGRLQDIMSRMGGEAAFEEQWAVNVDRDVMERFRQLARAAQLQ